MKVICTKMVSSPKSTFVGLCDLYLPEFAMELKQCTMWQKNGKRWVRLAQKSYVNDQGSRVYEPYVVFTKPEVQKDFNDSALKAIDKYCEEHANAPN